MSSAPPVSDTPRPGRGWPAAITIGQVVTLTLAVLTLAVCGYRLTVFAAGSADVYTPPELPQSDAGASAKERYNATVGNYMVKHGMRSQERANVTASTGMLVGVALAFVAIALSLTAAQAEFAGGEVPATTAARAARWAPGVVALVSAAAVTAACASEAKPPGPGGLATPISTFVPQQAIFAPSFSPFIPTAPSPPLTAQ